MRLQLVTISLITMVTPFCACGQENVGAAGGEASGSTGSVSYTVGQVANASNASVSGSVSEGVQQTYTSISTVIDETGPGAAGIVAYPNPANDRVRIAFESIPTGELEFTLYDASGAVVRFGELHVTDAEISINDLAVGRYRLILTTNGSVIRQFNLIKQ